MRNRAVKFVTVCGGIQPLPMLPPTRRENMFDFTARQWNRIICAVNSKKTAQQADLKTDEELEAYRRMWQEAEEHLEKYGEWPVFELFELE